MIRRQNSKQSNTSSLNSKSVLDSQRSSEKNSFCLFSDSKSKDIKRRNSSAIVSKEEVKLVLNEINLLPQYADPSLKKSSLSTANEYITSTYIPNYSDEDFRAVAAKYHLEYLKQLKIQLDQLDYNCPGCDNIEIFDSIGYVATLSNMYKSEKEKGGKNKKLIEKLKDLPSLCYRWRKIKGDGNCFYRAVFFSYLESFLLYEENSLRFRDIIIDIALKCEEPKMQEILKQYNIKQENIMLCLFVIYFILDNKSDPKCVKNAYSYLIKCFNNSPQFDSGIILYFRYILYKFLSQNENKCYTKDFCVQLGNLLPAEYESNDGFMFNKFYDEFLLRLFKDAEKIIIYITPYVLDINLNILMFQENQTLENMKFLQHAENTQDFGNIITILYRGAHYDISYNQRFVKDYEEYINIYTYDYFMVKQRKREIEMQRQIARQREEEERLKKIQEEREKREKEDKISIIDPIVKNGKKNRPGSINMVINENNNVDNENRKEIDSVYDVINNGGHQVIENQPKEMEFDLEEQKSLDDDLNERNKGEAINSLRKSLQLDTSNLSGKQKIKNIEQYQNKNVVPNSFLKKSNFPKTNQGIDKTSTSFKNVELFDKKKQVPIKPNPSLKQSECHPTKLKNKKTITTPSAIQKRLKNYLKQKKNIIPMKKQIEVVDLEIKAKVAVTNKFKEDEIKSKIKEIKKKNETNDNNQLLIKTDIHKIKAKSKTMKLTEETHSETNDTTKEESQRCRSCFELITKENGYLLCNKCLLVVIKTILCKRCRNYIQRNKIPTNILIRQTFLASIDLEEIQINKKKVNLNQLLNAYNSNREEQEQKIEKKNLIREIQSLVCVNCDKINQNFKSNSIIFPCGCSICSLNCLKEYAKTITHLLLNHSFNELYTCLCNKSYNEKQLEELNQLYQKETKEDMLSTQITQYKDSYKCAQCSKSFEELRKQKDKLLYEIQCSYETNNDSTIKHYICKNCNGKLKANNYLKYLKMEEGMPHILCSICGLKHYIQSCTEEKL